MWQLKSTFSLLAQLPLSHYSHLSPNTHNARTRTHTYPSTHTRNHALAHTHTITQTQVRMHTLLLLSTIPSLSTPQHPILNSLSHYLRLSTLTHTLAHTRTHPHTPAHTDKQALILFISLNLTRFPIEHVVSSYFMIKLLLIGLKGPKIESKRV